MTGSSVKVPSMFGSTVFTVKRKIQPGEWKDANTQFTPGEVAYVLEGPGMLFWVHTSKIVE